MLITASSANQKSSTHPEHDAYPIGIGVNPVFPVVDAIRNVGVPTQCDGRQVCGSKYFSIDWYGDTPMHK